MLALDQYANVVIESCMAVFCAVAIVYTVLIRNRNPASKRWMTGFLFMGVLYNLAEIGARIFKGVVSDTAYIMIRVSNLAAYLSLFILILLAVSHLWRKVGTRGGKPGKYLHMAGHFFCAVGMAAMLLNIFFGFYYTFDAQNRFQEGPFYWAHLLVALLASLPILLLTVLNRNALHRIEYRSFLCLGVLPLISVPLQRMLPWDISLYVITVSISILIIFSGYRREAAHLSIIRESLQFSAEQIDMISQGLENFMSSFEMEKMSRYRVRLTVEEALLRMRDRFGEDEEFDVFASISFGRPYIRIEKKGALFNPLRKESDSRVEMGGKLLTSIGYNMVFSYAGGRNILKLSLERQQMNPALKMLIALMIGMIAGNTAIAGLSEANRQILYSDILLPIYGMMSNLLYCVTGPILFLMVITVILDTAGISEQGGNSLSMVSRFFALSLSIGAVSLLTVICVLGRNIHGVSMGENNLKTVLEGLLSIVPEDMFSPFMEANTPQLLLMAVVTGLAVVVLGSKTTELQLGIRQVNMAGLQVARWIGGIIPYFAAVMAALIFLSHHLMDFVIMVIVLLASLIISGACMIAVLLYTSFRYGVRPIQLVRKCRPCFLVALRKGSLDASYDLAEHCCTRALGIDRNFAVDGLPLGLVMYMPANVVGTLLFIMYAAVRSDVTISPLWMSLSVILAVVLFAATPPIAGANFLAYIVMIATFGISKDFLMLALIYEIIYGIFASAFNQFFVQMELTLQAGKMGLLREDVLRKP